MDRIEYLALCDDLRKHNYLYYVLDEPIIDDFKYDQLFKSVKQAEVDHPEWVTPDSPTQTVGHPVYPGCFEVTKHLKPMLSLDNLFSSDEAVDWTIDIHGDIDNYKADDYVEVVTEWKMDGLSLSLEYEFGQLRRAITRGDGNQGEDVTPNALMIEGIPRTVKTHQPVMLVRGEVLPRLNDYQAINRSLEESGKKTYANPRNYAAGALRLKDPKVTKERKLCFVAHGPEFINLSDEENNADWYDDQLWLTTNGFMTADTGKRFDHSHKGLTTGIPGVLDQCLVDRPNYPFEVDGIVFKVVSHRHRMTLGFTSRYPRWARAYKFPASKGVTRLISVDRQVGRTGRLTPMARLAPVHIHGTTITNVTIHNLKELEQHQLFAGCEVELSRAGDVIPYLERRITKHKDEPIYGLVDKCPCCGKNVLVVEGKAGSKTEYCPNTKCKDRLVAHLVYCASRGVLNIKGLGDELVLSLYKAGIVDVERPLSLLNLTKEDFLKLGQSELMADKLTGAVLTAKVNLDLTRVITALGIDNVAEGTAERLARNLRTLDAISKATVDELKAIDDIGDITAQSIFEYFDEDRCKPDELSAYKPYVIDLYLPAPEPLGTLFKPGTTFVVTGSMFGLFKRKGLEDYLKKNGAKVTSTVTKSTTAIYCGTKHTTHKLETAKVLGVPYAIYDTNGLVESNIIDGIDLKV